MANGYYEDGTVSITSGAAALVGVGTAWESTIRAGDKFTRNGYSIPVLAVVDDTHITLEYNYPGTPLSGATYKIELLPDLTRGYEAILTLVELIRGNGNVEAFADLVGAADKLGYFTGVGTMALTDLTALARELMASTTLSTMQTVLGMAGAVPQGRLTLSSGIPVTASDVAGAGTIYYTQAGAGRGVPVWNTADSELTIRYFTELSLTLDSNSGHTGYHQSGRNFDLFVINDNGTDRLVTGPSWNAGAVAGSDTARGTGAGSTELEYFQGILVNKNQITARFGSASGNTVVVPARAATYVGSFRATANGQASDTKTKRLLYNAYNQAPRLLEVLDAAAGNVPPGVWNYSAGAWQQANANTANQVEVLLGNVGVPVSLHVLHTVSSTVVGAVRTGIGMDAAASAGPTGKCIFGYQYITTTGSPMTVTAFYDNLPGLGYHTFLWLEIGIGSGTQTWVGISNNRTGMFGLVTM